MFSEEEKCLLHMLGAASRGQAMDRIRSFMNSIVDADYIRLCIHTIKKLKAMSDVDFIAVLQEMDRRG